MPEPLILYPSDNDAILISRAELGEDLSGIAKALQARHIGRDVHPVSLARLSR